MYQMVPEVEREYQCPFVVQESYETRAVGQRYYVTPGCLVYKESEDAFYDPCDVSGDVCSGETPGPVSLGSLVSKIPFDPRQASDGKPIGYWPVQFDTGRAGAEDDELTQLADAVREFELNTQIPRGLSGGFVQDAVRAGGQTLHEWLAACYA